MEGEWREEIFGMCGSDEMILSCEVLGREFQNSECVKTSNKVHTILLC